VENNGSNVKKTKVFIICGVLLLSAVSASWTLSERPLNNHECFVSITAREMLQSGDWVIPTCNGELRLEKTPLSYWLVAGLTKITGQVDEFTARLPSAILAVLSAAAILYFVNQWLPFRIAVLSTLIWATSLGYVRYAHSARPETSLTFFVTLCLLSFYSGITAKVRKKQVIYMLVFWVSFGFGMLAKGPAPLPLVLIPLFFYVAIFRQWKKITQLLPVVGVIVFLAIVLPWPLAIAYRMNWNLVVWKHEFIERFFGTYASGGNPPYFYLPLIFQFIAPWVAFVPAALISPFYKIWGKKQKTMLFFWLWFVANLIFLTISGGRRKHYIIPAMPAIAILVGILIEDMVFVRRAFTQKFARNFLIYHMLALTVSAFAGPIYMAIAHPEFLFRTLTLSLIGLAMVGAICVSFAKRKAALACGVLFGGYCTLIMICYVNFLNPLNYNNYSKNFALAILGKVPKKDNLVAYERVSKRVVHYFGRPIPVIKTKSLLYQHYDRGDWVVATGGSLQKLTDESKLRIIYFAEKAERRRQRRPYGYTSGSLFHKSASKDKGDT
jgi:4-amino-4-deoxy-L-arabinose transferase-like glycosyltransferase